MVYRKPWAVTPDDIAYIHTLPEDQWANTLDTLYVFDYNSFKVPSILSYVILGTFAFFVLLVSISPLLVRLRLPLRRVERFLSAPTYGKRFSQALTIIPSPSGKNAWVTFHLPLRWQSFAILSLWIVNILGVTAFYTPTPGPTNAYWPSHSTFPQILRYLSDRSGILATAQMVLVYLLAGRNSPIAVFTRGHITFETLMLFHRWVARVVAVQAFIHGLSWSVSFMYYDYYNSTAFEPYAIWGVVAVVLFCLLCFQSLRSLRNWGYETFVIVHTIFAILALVGVYYHIHLLDAVSYSEYMNYLYTIMAFWGFDRTLRLLRLTVFNINIYGRSAERPSFLSTASLLVFPSSIAKSSSPSGESTQEDPPTLILRIRPVGVAATRTGMDFWAPGQHVYLAIPSLQPFTSHPFTVLSSGMYAPDMLTQDTSETSCPSQDEKNGLENSRPSSSTSLEIAARPYIDIAWVPRDGLTKSLARRLSDASKHGELTVLVDGPYGPWLDLKSYSFIQLAAGGIGATYPLPFFFDTVRRDTMRLALGGSDSEAQSGRTPMNFVWAVRTMSAVEFALPYLEDAIIPLQEASGRDKQFPYSISIYVTHPRCTQDDATAEDEKGIRSSFERLAPYVQVRWFEGRPSLVDAVERSQEASISGRGGRKGDAKVALIVCGPAGLCDDARSAASQADAKGPVRVDYYEESFTW